MAWPAKQYRVFLAHTVFAFLLFLVIEFGEIIPIRQRGFFTRDPALSYPLLEESLPTSSLIIVVIAGAFMVELTNFFFAHKSKALPKSYPILTYVLGYSWLLIVVDVAKAATGELRPHFIAGCEPLYDISDSDDTNPLGTWISVGSYTCAHEDEARNVREAFPSGHAASAFYFSISICFQILLAMKTWTGRLGPDSALAAVVYSLSLGTMALVLGSALVMTLDRVSDYQHHLHDVICGAMLGIGFAIGVYWWQQEYGQTVAQTVAQSPGDSSLTAPLQVDVVQDITTAKEDVP